jgi:hypothetical protein
MHNTFVEVANSIDILGDKHTTSTLEIIVDMESEILFINNSSFILDFTPKLTQQ